MKKCQFCAEMIDDAATTCPLCNSSFKENLERTSPNTPPIRPAEGKLFDVKVAMVLAVFFSPIFAAAVGYHNWKAVGDIQQQQRAKKWLWGVTIATLMLWSLIGYLPTLVLLPVWFFGNGKALTSFKPECLQNKFSTWKKPALLGFVGIIVLSIVMSVLIDREPCLDLNTRETHNESARQVLKYLVKEHDYDRISQLYQNDYYRTTAEEKKVFEVMKAVFIYISLNPPKELDGSSASEIWDYYVAEYDRMHSGQE